MNSERNLFFFFPTLYLSSSSLPCTTLFAFPSPLSFFELTFRVMVGVDGLVVDGVGGLDLDFATAAIAADAWEGHKNE